MPLDLTGQVDYHLLTLPTESSCVWQYSVKEAPTSILMSACCFDQESGKSLKGRTWRPVSLGEEERLAASIAKGDNAGSRQAWRIRCPRVIEVHVAVMETYRPTISISIRKTTWLKGVSPMHLCLFIMSAWNAELWCWVVTQIWLKRR